LFGNWWRTRDPLVRDLGIAHVLAALAFVPARPIVGTQFGDLLTQPADALTVLLTRTRIITVEWTVGRPVGLPCELLYPEPDPVYRPKRDVGSENTGSSRPGRLRPDVGLGQVA
jgi:hypothetical protein